MIPLPRPRRFAATLLAVLLALPACTRTFLYRHDNLPRLTGSRAHIPEQPDDAPEAWPVDTVLLLHRQRGRVPPTPDEWRRFQAGQLADVDGAALEVSTTPHVLRNHTLLGGAIGLGFGLALALLVVPGDLEDALGFPAVAMIEGALLGAAVGAVAMSGEEDRRLDGAGPRP